MGWRQTLGAAAVVGVAGAWFLGMPYLVAPEETRQAVSELVALVQTRPGEPEQARAESAETIPAAELPGWVEDRYIDGAELVFDEVLGGGNGPERVRLYERYFFSEDDPCRRQDWEWIVLLVDRQDATQIFYQDWKADGELNAVAFTSGGTTRFYENELVRVFRAGDETVLEKYDIGGPLFDEGNPQLAAYLHPIYSGIGTYAERHPHPECDADLLQQEDLELLRGER